MLGLVSSPFSCDAWTPRRAAAELRKLRGADEIMRVLRRRDCSRSRRRCTPAAAYRGIDLAISGRGVDEAEISGSSNLAWLRRDINVSW